MLSPLFRLQAATSPRVTFSKCGAGHCSAARIGSDWKMDFFRKRPTGLICEAVAMRSSCASAGGLIRKFNGERRANRPPGAAESRPVWPTARGAGAPASRKRRVVG